MTNRRLAPVAALAVGVTLVIVAPEMYARARSNYDRQAVQASSTGCVERARCPTPTLDVVPTAIFAGIGVTVIAVSLAAALNRTTPQSPERQA